MVNRDVYLKKLINKIDNGAIKIITGLRRSGKLTLLFNIFYNYLISQGHNETNIIKVDLDSDEYESLKDYKKLGEYIRAKIKENEHYFILLDEVQFCQNFEKVLNSLNRNPNLDIYVTGSNSKFLSTDILTEFRGRGDEIRVYSLSFKEVFDASSNTDFGDVFNSYLRYGGM